MINFLNGRILLSAKEKDFYNNPEHLHLVYQDIVMGKTNVLATGRDNIKEYLQDHTACHQTFLIEVNNRNIVRFNIDRFIKRNRIQRHEYNCREDIALTRA